MKVLKENRLVGCDVDQTLIASTEVLPKTGTPFNFIFNGQNEVRYPIINNIKYLKQLKQQGNAIIVWSQQGWEWAETIVKQLKIQKYVTLAMSKPTKIIDDQPFFYAFPQIEIIEFNEE